ncbi:hypothetical protein L1987_75850 [Smallanthus sonchifolius]|uniref:Uncharacterized protein n=1 Tax=Smallanthus sonchifolius TaxID=185202 RepID=A0ACB9A7V1_9ASTR|nr:hypothetical protein L1987_75850 [Smallanthus sonchifolius]
MTNVICYKNSIVVTKSFKLTILVFIVFSISFMVLSALSGQMSRLTTLYRNIPETTTQQQDSSPCVSDPPTEISHVLFGIGGSVHTWRERRHYSELWWQPNITRGFVWLDEEPNPDLLSHPNSLPFKVSENVTRVNNVGSNPAVRIARIVVESFKLGLPDVRWFVMGDDDTVFFADNLVSVLSRYDHRQMYYVGGSSESVEQDVMHSYDTAFGGGGFAVSYPLVAELARIFDGCLDRYRYFYGSDERVSACVSELGVPLTKERGFHQMDIRGDAYGLLAAHPMTPLVSLHHLDYIKPLLPNLTNYESLNTLIQTYRFDPPRVMQQSFCYYKTWWHSWSISVSWGYTVQIYPSLLTAQELEIPLQTFLTWMSFKDGPFTFNTRPMPTSPCDLPAIYYISHVQEAGNDTITTYTRDKPVGICKKRDYPRTIKTVVVSASKMNPNYWMEGPRRQCCEIKGWKYNSLKIRVRHCKDGETITA